MKEAVPVRQRLHEPRVEPSGDGNRPLPPGLVEKVIEHVANRRGRRGDLHGFGLPLVVEMTDVPADDAAAVPTGARQQAAGACCAARSSSHWNVRASYSTRASCGRGPRARRRYCLGRHILGARAAAGPAGSGCPAFASPAASIADGGRAARQRRQRAPLAQERQREPRRPQRARPVEAVQQRGRAAEPFPDALRRVVGFVRDRQDPGDPRESLGSRTATSAAASGIDDELRADGSLESAVLNRHPPRHDAEKADDPSVVSSYTSDGSGRLAGRILEKHAREVGVIPLRLARVRPRQA